MNLLFSEQAWEDYLYWQRHDKKMLQRIHALIQEIQRDPYRGTGKPEPLKFSLKGFWSRRIDEEHRIVYRIREDRLEIAQLRYHYE